MDEIKKSDLENISSIRLTELAAKFQLSDARRSQSYSAIALEKAKMQNDASLIAKNSLFLGMHAFYATEYAKASQYFNDALKYSENKGETAASAINYLGNVYLAKGDYQSAIARYFEALRLSETGENSVRVHMNLGTVYKHLSDYENAIKYYLEALDINEKKVNNNLQEALINANIGSLYFELEEYGKSFKYIDSAFQTFVRLEDWNSAAIAHLFFSKFYEKFEEFGKSLEEAQSALELGQTINNQLIISSSLHQIGVVFIERGETDAGIGYLSEALDIARKYKLTEVEAKILMDFGEFHFNSGAFAKAKSLLFESIKQYKLTQHEKPINKCYTLLSKIYEEEKDFLSALFYARQHYVNSKPQSLNDQAYRIEIQILLKTKENEIHQLTKENSLQAELIKKNEHIEIQNKALVKANEELQRFAYVVSHDFKEPLRMIGSYTQLLERYLKPHLKDDTVEFMNYVTNGVNRMNTMIDKLLQYARIDSRSFDPETVDLNQVLEEVELYLHVQISESHAKITTVELPKIEGHYHQAVQLFQNLISNAIKFRQEPPPLIDINYEINHQYGIVSVTDNGIGIDSKDIDKVFEVFFRSENRRKIEGTGLGLATCKKVMDKLKGKIWLESTVNQGTTFFLAFPKSIIIK